MKWWILFHHQGPLEKTITWAKTLLYSMIFRKLHWIWSGCVAIFLLLKSSLFLCTQLQNGSGFVIFQENKSLVAGSLSSLRDNTVVLPDKVVAQHSPFIFSFLFFVRKRENELGVSHGNQEPLIFFFMKMKSWMIIF
jgi:hypothetical protein